MIIVKDKIVLVMALLRVFSSLIEMSAAILFLRFDSVEKALKINAFLALVGPLIMSAVMLTGLVGLSGKVPHNKFITILAGVILILIGVSKNR